MRWDCRSCDHIGYCDDITDSALCILWAELTANCVHAPASFPRPLPVPSFQVFPDPSFSRLIALPTPLSPSRPITRCNACFQVPLSFPPSLPVPMGLCMAAVPGNGSPSCHATLSPRQQGHLEAPLTFPCPQDPSEHSVPGVGRRAWGSGAGFKGTSLKRLSVALFPVSGSAVSQPLHLHEGPYNQTLQPREHVKNCLGVGEQGPICVDVGQILGPL